ncbi:MAG: hypothetical protein V4553_04520 [Bacteroidota bacterium]
MTEPNQADDNQNPDEAANPGNQSGETPNQQLHSASNQGDNTNTSNRHPKFIKLKKWIKRENKETGGIANIIAFIALIIGGFLAIYTYKVFNQTTKQTIASLKADSIAQDALKFQRQSQKSADSSRRISDSLQSKKDNRSLALQDSSVKAQIASIETTQKQFEIESRPFVSVENFVSDTPSIGSVVNYSMQIVNTGKQPAFIIDNYYDVKPSIDSSLNTFDKIAHPTAHINSVITGNGGGFAVHSHTIAPMTKETISYIKENPFYIYARAIISYRSFIGKKVYKTSVIIRLNTNKDHAAKTMVYKSD